MIEKSGQFGFKCVTLAYQHLHTWFFFSKLPTCVLEKRINVPSYTLLRLLRAMEIRPGRTKINNYLLDLSHSGSVLSDDCCLYL